MEDGSVAKTRTDQGKQSILYRGYRYSTPISVMGGDGLRWRCSALIGKGRKCNGKLRSGPAPEYLNAEEYGTHMCGLPNPEGTVVHQVTAANLKRNAKEMTAEGSLKAAYETAVLNLPATCPPEQVPVYRSIKSALYRKRAENLPAGIPQERENIVIPDTLQRSTDGSQFVLHSAPANDHIIFATTAQLKLLASKTEWFVDGTFKVVPALFTQLWSIHVMEGNTLVPVVFVLMSGKSQAKYVAVVRAVKDALVALNEDRAIVPPLNLVPATIMMDFETGAIAALRSEFPGIQLKGCLFHHTQAVFRHVQQLGLSNAYVAEPETRSTIRKLLALAFVPPQMIEAAFDQLVDDCSLIDRVRLQPLFDYYRNQWLHNATITLQMFNMHGVQRRTNNNLEGYHNRLRHRMPVHPNIFAFISALLREEAVARVSIAQIAAGQDPTGPGKQLYVRINQRVANVTQQFDTGVKSVSEYVAALAHILSEPTKLSL